MGIGIEDCDWGQGFGLWIWIVDWDQKLGIMIENWDRGLGLLIGNHLKSFWGKD